MIYLWRDPSDGFLSHSKVLRSSYDSAVTGTAHCHDEEIFVALKDLYRGEFQTRIRALLGNQVEPDTTDRDQYLALCQQVQDSIHAFLFPKTKRRGSNKNQ